MDDITSRVMTCLQTGQVLAEAPLILLQRPLAVLDVALHAREGFLRQPSEMSPSAVKDSDALARVCALGRSGPVPA